nr:uncharacterized protein LOC101239254 isoform X2 [Hydra vulgaris]
MSQNTSCSQVQKEWIRVNCQPDICSCLPCGDFDDSAVKKTTNQVSVDKKNIIVKNTNDKLRYFFSELGNIFQDKIQNNKKEKVDDLLRYLYKIYSSLQQNNRSKFFVDQKGGWKINRRNQVNEHKTTESLQLKNK